MHIYDSSVRKTVRIALANHWNQIEKSAYNKSFLKTALKRN